MKSLHSLPPKSRFPHLPSRSLRLLLANTLAVLTAERTNMNKRLAAILLLLALLPQKAPAQTQQITIGQLKYIGTGVQSDGSVESLYELGLDATNVTVDPITFSNIILTVKGTAFGTKQGGFPFITTGLGCGNPPYQTSCDLLFTGKVGTKLATCATYNAVKNTFKQSCVSIGLQFVSSTGKNVAITLSDGSNICTNGIANVFLLAKQDQVALDPQCGADGFCVGASVPVILHAVPAGSCNQ
jgi:hypothetical protein